MASQTVELSGSRAVARLWGAFAIEDPAGGASLRPRGRKPRALLAYLIAHAGSTIGRDRLTGLLWGERAEEQARASLRQCLFELRALAQGPSPLMHVDRETVRIDADAVTTELDRARALLDANDLDGVAATLPGPDDIFLASLDGIDLEFDAWLRLERARQAARLAALVADAVAAADRLGAARAGRELRLRLRELDPPEPRDLEAPRPDRLPSRIAGPPAPARSASARLRALVPSLALALVGCAAATAPWLILRGDIGESSTRREAQALTASAQTMLKARTTAEVKAASELLRRAVEIDPGFAPAWAALATARVLADYSEPGRREAERLARRALELDPALAEAHATLGMVLGFAGREAGQHLAKAAALDPNDAQIQFWLSNYHMNRLAFGPRMAALRRAVAIDPRFPRASMEAATAAWELGRREEARSYFGRMGEQEAGACMLGIDLAEGNLAGIVQTFGASRSRGAPLPGVEGRVGTALLILGYVEPARLLMRLPDYQWEVARGTTPGPALFRMINVNADNDWLDSHVFLDLAVQRLLAAGRAADVVAAYDMRERGALGLVASDDDRSALIDFAPDVALALRAVGRAPEAEALLTRVDRLVRDAYRAGAVPNWFEARAARLFAVQGRQAEAVAALRRAIARGWRYTPVTPHPDLADVYAFREMRGRPDFAAVRAALLRQLAAQRTMLGPKPV
jgi:DNA-binding SARP family transcriptional activator